MGAETAENFHGSTPSLKPQWMNGLSERLLVSHYENNYGGALRWLNAIRARPSARGPPSSRSTAASGKC